MLIELSTLIIILASLTGLCAVIGLLNPLSWRYGWVSVTLSTHERIDFILSRLYVTFSLSLVVVCLISGVVNGAA